MPKIIKSILLLFSYLTIQYNCLAQKPVYKHYNTENGLAGNSVYSILYDNEGFIWLGTDYGVSKFDGKNFVNYTLTNGLSDIQILKIKQDSKGRIWFLGFNGTVSYWHNGKIFNANTDSSLKEIISENSFRDLYEDDEHDLWFISLIETLIYRSPKIIHKFNGYPALILKSSKGYISNNSNCIRIIDKLNKSNETINLKYRYIGAGSSSNLGLKKVFFISKNGVVYQNDTIQKLIIPFNRTFNNIRISNMLLTKDSLLFLCAIGKGLYCYNLKKTNSEPIIYLKNKLINDVTIDDEGNIWSTTLDDGVFMIPNYSNEVSLFDKESGMDNNKILALCKLKNDLIIGVFPNKLYSLTEKKIKPMSIAIEKSNNKIIQIKSNGDDIWISLEFGFFHKNKKNNNYLYEKRNDKSFKVQNVKDMYIGKKELLMATANGSLAIKLASNKLARRITPGTFRTYSIFEDYTGKIWYGSISGLQSINGNIKQNHAIENKLLANRINAIVETADSTLVLATNGFGILFYKKGKLILNVTEKNGLSSNICKKVMLFDNSIYLITNNGISILQYSKGKINDIKILNTNNYLHTNEINDLVIDSNYLYIATNNGLLTIEKDIINLAVIKKPIFYITEFGVNDSLFSHEKFTELPFNKNNVRIKYIGIYYQQPNAVLYRYRLKNNQEWTLTNKSILEFPFLEPDNYKFEIQAKIIGGNWTESKLINFEIKFPFYKQTWFVTILITFSILCLIIFFRFQIKKINKRQAEKDEVENTIAKLKQQALQSLMNPHFIFNVMNSLQQFINVNNKESANRYLSNFAKLIRLNLDISSKQFIFIEEELSYLKLYLSFEQLRFGQNLKYEIIIDPIIDVSDSYIPVMMIQPFVENAIWHGILPTQTIGKISISIIQIAPDLIKVSIEDNGKGIKEEFLTNNEKVSYAKNHALSMTDDRLKLIAKTTNHKLTIQFKYKYPDKEMKGTIAEILLPIS